MQVKKKCYCDFNMFHKFKEEQLKRSDGTYVTLSITNGTKFEYMIFLGRDSTSSDYEVRVYKYSPADKYVPNNEDNIRSYEENDEYITFYFNSFYDAQRFIWGLGYRHPELKKRPIRKINDIA